MTALEKVLARVAGAKQTGPERYMARCGAHEDRSPSLSIRGIDDRVLLKCHAGCNTGDVLAAMGLRMGDLFDKPIAHHMAPVRQPFNAAEVLTAVAHEITVSMLITHDIGVDGRCDMEQRTRLLLAEQRMTQALCMIEMSVPEQVKRIRRGEVRS